MTSSESRQNTQIILELFFFFYKNRCLSHQGVQLLIEGVRGRISKETYSNVITRGGGGGSGPPVSAIWIHPWTMIKAHTTFETIGAVHTKYTPYLYTRHDITKPTQ